jgi:signal transduction histidine kinase
MAGLDGVILYVDDERSNRVVFEQSFGRRFKVQTAASGSEALERLKANAEIAVLVTDERMPDMSGNELLFTVKQLNPDVVRIAITAYSDLEPILRAVNEGLVARYIIKPWDAAELEGILAWSLEAFHLGRENSELQLRLIQTERLVTLGSIAATVIHDLSQPLSYLMTNSERLSQLVPAAPFLGGLVAREGSTLTPETHKQLADLSEELPDIVRDMLEGCRLMHALISSMRRLTQPPSPLEPRSCDPLQVIRYALSVCRNLAITCHAGLAYDGPTTLPKVSIGSTELSQTLINLIENAAQAVGRRQGSRGHIRLMATESAAEVCLVVSDDGPGMPPEILERVGTPFFSTRTEGTGLGVAQCRRLVERAGGTLTIESKLGVGTSAAIALPRL